MPTPVTYLSGGTLGYTSGMFKRGTMSQGFGFPLTNGYKWWNGVDVTSSQYLIYSDQYTMGTVSQANSIPVAWSTPDLTDASLLALINSLPPRVGLPGFTSLSAALNWLQSTNQFFLLKNGYENIVTSNLQLCYDAGWYTSYNGTGTSVTDLSGNNRTGTLLNSVGFNNSGVGAFVFDGADDAITAGDVCEVTNGDFSMEAWVKINSLGTFQIIVQKGNPGVGSNPGYRMRISDVGTIEFVITSTAGVETQINSSTPIQAGIWYNIHCSRSGTNMKIYINGILSTDGSGTNGSLDSGSAQFYIGRQDGGNWPLNGQICSVKFYSSQLTAEQVLQNYNTQRARFGYFGPVTNGLITQLEAANPASYSGSGTIWYDISGRNNNFTLFNGITYNSTNKSFTFDGSDDYARSTNYIDLSPYSGVTVQIITKENSTANSYFLWEHTPDWNVNNGGFGIVINSTGSGYYLDKFHANWYGQEARNFYNPLPSNQSFFLETHRLIKNNILGLQDWVNGDLQTFIGSEYQTGTSTLGNNNGFSNHYLFLGARNGNVLNYNGNISVFLMYNRPLSQPEVIQNFEYYRNLYNITGVTKTGMVLWVDGGNYASYPTSGTTWYDISGSVFDGIVTNGPTYSPYIGYFTFDGSDDYVSLSNYLNFSTAQFSNGYTISLWVYPTRTSGRAVLFSSAQGPSGGEWQLYLWYDTGKFGTAQRYGTNQNDFDATGTYATENWYNVVITSNNSTCKIYVNAVERNSNTTGQPTNNPAGLEGRIGGFKNYSANFEGKIGDTIVYNRVLSGTEITQNYNALYGRYNVAYPSALAILSIYPSAPNGLYLIKPPGASTAQQIYCDMTGGGWMLVCSNNALSTTIPGGTGRNNVNYILSRSTVLGTPDPNSDYIIGSIIDYMEFTQVKILGWGYTSINGTYTYPSNLGTYVTATWSLTTTGNNRFTEKVARANVTIGGNGTVAPAAQYFVLDTVRNDINYDANVNQSTVGASGVFAANGDPSDGCYLGHGVSEGSYEGWYDTNSTVHDSQGYTTWVR